MTVRISRLFYAPHRRAWRAWLKKHSATETEIWLVYYRKQSGKPRIPYEDAVEEALCFGWIDSTVKKLDDERFVQRFSPRKPGSTYSQANRERLRKLARQGKVSTKVLAEWGDILKKKFTFPPDILKALKSNKRAWENFQRFPRPYQRIRVAFIDASRGRPDEFRKRLRYFLRMAEQNKQFGFGITEFL